MHRADARTVSYTVIELGGDAVTMTYYGDAPDRPAVPVTTSLSLNEAACA